MTSAMPRSSCGVEAVDYGGGIIFNDDIWIHAVAFDDELGRRSSLWRLRERKLRRHRAADRGR